MRIWTYGEARQKVERDLDLQGENFITPTEMLGLFNEGLENAGGEVNKINEDYFLTESSIPLIAGRNIYNLPPMIFAQKIRKVLYQNETLIYEMVRYRGLNEFTDMSLDRQFPTTLNTNYRYMIANPSSKSGYQMRIGPTPLETRGTAVTLVIGTSTVFTTVSAHGLAVGNEVQLSTTGALPTGLSVGVPYYVASIPTAYTFTLSHTLDGSALDTTGTQTGSHLFEAAPYRIALWHLRNPARVYVDSDLMDIPESTNYVMQYVKVRCYEKEGHPMLEKAIPDLERERLRMIDLLTERIPDDDTIVQGDMTLYNEHS